MPSAVVFPTQKEFVSEDGLLSVRDWLVMGETKPHYELINGQLIQKMTTTRKHTRAAGKFLVQCDVWAEKRGWEFFPEGTGVYVSERIGYVPDVVGFGPGVEINPNAAVEGAPTLVVEVLSPSTATRDRTQKKRDYARIGVQIYILLDPNNKTMDVFRLKGNRFGPPETLRENEVWAPQELPELRLELEKLWM